MAAPETSPYILATPDTALTGSRTLEASGGLAKEDTGPTNSMTITTVGNLANLNLFGSAGFVTYNLSSQQFLPKTLLAGTGITISNPDGQVGDTSISVTPNTTLQRIQIQKGGVFSGERAAINFIPGANTSITAGDNPLNGTVDISISTSTSFAPEAAKYIVQTPDLLGLPNAQPLNAFPPETILKVIADGVVSAAVADTDYQSASPHLTQISTLTATTGELIVGTGITFGGITPGPIGSVLTSGGTSSVPSWEPNNSGQPFPVVYVENAPLTVMQPNTFYSARANIDNCGFNLPDGVVTPPSPTPLPNYGDQFLFAASSPGPTYSAFVISTSVVNLLDGATTYTNVQVGMDVPVGQSGFIWFMYIGIIAGKPTYQVLSKSSNILFST